ncbi:hypothetical protein AM587_10008898 [Phytophthora nicotianae]|uniref:Uncharacterized protein n=2 Tax=Phytophthora nicotianae TaxID=4792 RepID=A0A0W8CBU6_PHYNI|nr:hypothetical protein F444_10210 [Phytophthora nicotianae P1976]KUF78253.1 hypothetical protein AM587_10012657 [Phytophthora nicotianae]KUF81545.1 hypothetical protein AM587_10008898 [Phytophthora nicotianae]KUF98747.1 hypothetical protein AM588_10009209 [Phytophthora nicotianae]
MVEHNTRHAATPTVASLLSDVAWHDKLNSAAKENIIGKAKAVPNWEDEQEANNQEEDGSSAVDNARHDHNDVKIPLRKCETLGKSLDRDELRHLRTENATLSRRLTQMEKEHARSVEKLETKLQQTIATHRQIEQRLRSQLQTVLHEQQAAAENARKVRTILNRITKWMRQVQRAAQRERSLRNAKPVAQDLELRMTPCSESSYKLWTSGANLATNVSKCEESPTASNKFSLNQGPLQWPDSYKILIDNNVNPVPPPPPGRNRAKSLPAKGFNYVGYPVLPPAEGSLTKPSGGTEVVLDGLPPVDASPRRVRKRSAGSLLAYCAQVVTASLAGARSSPSPQAKVTPVWKLDSLLAVREEHEIDEEAGQCSRSATNSKPLDVALPNLSIGLL